MRLLLPRNARIFTNFEAAAHHLATFHGIDETLASERLHEIKYAMRRSPAENVLFDRTGNVYAPETNEWLGSLTQGGAKRFKRLKAL